MSGVPIHAFPSCIDYTNHFYSIPEETVSYEVVSTTNNGSSFSNGQSMYVDIAVEPHGFIEPASIIVSYKDLTTTAANAQRLGCPFATPFLKLTNKRKY